MLRDLRKEYLAQLDAYRGLRALASRQAGLEIANELISLKEIASQKKKLLEEISLRDNYLEIMKKEICKDLSIEEFNLSSLKNKLEGEEIELLETCWQKIGQEIKDLQLIEEANEEKLKKVLKIR